MWPGLIVSSHYDEDDNRMIRAVGFSKRDPMDLGLLNLTKPDLCAEKIIKYYDDNGFQADVLLRVLMVGLTAVETKQLENILTKKTTARFQCFYSDATGVTEFSGRY